MIDAEIGSWSKQSLGDLCHFKNGLWKGKKEPYIHVGVIRNTNFTKHGFLDDTDIAFLDVEIKQYSSRKLEYGDIILEKSGGGPKQAVGRVIPFEKKKGEYSFSNFTSIIRIKDKEQLDHRFLHRFLFFCYIAGKTESMQKHSTGIRNLQLKEYKQLQIPLPPLSEQKRIVAILDKAFAGISQAVANAEKNLANARELFESYLNNVFTQKGDGWEVKPLESFSTIVNGYAFKSGDFSSQNEVKSIKITNVGVYEFVQRSDNYLPKNYVEEYSRYKAYEGDVVIALTRTIISSGLKVAVVPANYDGALINQRVAAVHVNEDVMPKEVLQAFLSTKIAIDYVRSNVNELMQPNLSIKDLKAFPIPVPPADKKISVVSQISELREKIDQLTSIYVSKIVALNELKQSILQKAFAGELH